MSRSPNIDWYRHLSFAAVGGFFAAYAILLRMGVMANAQTLNLLELLLNSLRGNWSSVLLHTGALVIYMLGTMSTVILPHLFGWNMRRVCPLIDAACAVLLAFFPEDMSILPSLYPIFFAMSVQWSSLVTIPATAIITSNGASGINMLMGIQPGKTPMANEPKPIAVRTFIMCSFIRSFILSPPLYRPHGGENWDNR